MNLWLLQARPRGSRLVEGRTEIRADRSCAKRVKERWLAEGFGELPPLWKWPVVLILGAYLPAKDSAALAAKAFDLLGMDSITFISCQS
jgi:hypothetical protein